MPPSDSPPIPSVPPSIKLLRLAHRSAFAVLRAWWFVRRPHTRGVKLLVSDGEQILFVRHAYGRAEWEIPGGGTRRHESSLEAAEREASEELGLSLEAWRVVGVVEARDRATATLTCLTVAYDGQPLVLALGELLEARWAPAATPPQPLGEHARAALDLLLD